MDRIYQFNCILILTMAWCWGSSLAVAQDDSLDDLMQQWNEIQQTFASKSSQLQVEPTNSNLKSEVEELVVRGKELVPRLKDKALEQWQQNPENRELLRQIMGILLHQASEEDDAQVLQTGDQLIQLNINPLYFEVAARTERLSISGREIFEELLIRQREATNDDLPRVQLNTNKGPIVIELFEDQARNTVANFITLVENGHFNGVLFHRVIEGFMAQAGERQLDGSMTPEIGYTIACECLSPETRRHFTHSISMAHMGANTGGGQFFLTFSRTSRLDGRHTCFGRIIEGADVLNSITRTHSLDDQELPDIDKDSIQSAEVVRKRDHDYRVRKFGQPEPKPDPKIDELPATPAVNPATEGSEGLPTLPERDQSSSQSSSQSEETKKKANEEEINRSGNSEKTDE